MAKYNDATLVDDLVARKTEAGLWVSNPDFPNNQDAPCSILFPFQFSWKRKQLYTHYPANGLAGLEGVLVLVNDGREGYQPQGQQYLHHFHRTP